jgi:predicted nucleotidyltransferase
MEVMMGSVAYGVNEEGASDVDVYGFCIPPKDVIFPHLRGEILGFGKQINRFEQYQQHHVEDKEARKSYDISIYNIVRYFQLVMENNPNMIDSLFVPHRCVLHITKVGNMVRDERKSFLHKGCWHKFKGYAYSQMHKMDIKEPEGKRKEMIEKFGYDVKFAYHVVRLLNEVEQILTEGDLDLERNREQLKSIRRGEWKIEDIRDYFSKKEKELESVYLNSKLPYGPDEEKIKTLLLSCLEEHYGSLDQAIVKPDSFKNLLVDLQEILNKYSSRI